MKRANFRKTIIGLIIVTMLSVQVLSPLQAAAAGWDTPSAGAPALGLSASDFLNPKLLVSVIGCTGIVDVVALASTRLIAKIAAELLGTATPGATAAISDATALSIAGSATIAANSAALGAATPGFPTADVGTRTILIGTNALLTANSTATNAILVNHGVSHDAIAVAASTSQAQDAATTAFKEQCLDGIAVALAKQELEKVTKSTLNWVGSGFNGNPLFVQNVDSFMNNITKDIINRENKFFGDPLNKAKYPYGQLYVQSSVNSYKSQNNLDSALQQNLTNYLVPGATPQSFATNFSQGGWNGWLALTQNPQNNPLGFVMVKSQATADQIATQQANTNRQLTASGGYLPQQKCVVYALDGDRTINKLNQLQSNVADAQANVTLAYSQLKNTSANTPGGSAVVDALNDAYNNAKANLVDAQGALKAANTDPANQNCTTWQVVTPGSAIRDKVTKTLNSPETQLELVKTINDALTYLFTALLSRFQTQGLSSLVTGPFDDVSGGFTANDITDANGNSINTANGNNGGDTGSGSSGFDITKDLAAVIQTQKDYIDAGAPALTTAKGVIPTLGQLDYCIPGPNLDWVKYADPTISSNAQFNDYSTAIEQTFGASSPMQSSGNSAYLAIAQPGLALTKDLPVDKITTDQQQQDIIDGTADANNNIAQLTIIKQQVDVIVAAATARRDAERVKEGLPPISSCLNTQ